MSDLQDISERIKHIRKSHNLTQKEFGESLGVDQAAISQLEKGKIQPSLTLVKRIVREFKEDYRFILEGKVQGKVQGNPSTEKTHQSVHKIAYPYKKTKKQTVHKIDYFNTGLPYYDIDVSAGPLELFSDKPEVVAEMLVIPGFQDCDLAVNVWGDSMHPRYQAGDIIICKKLHDKRYLLFGEAYLVVTKEMRTVKYVRKGSIEENVKLVSENQGYDDVEIPIDEVLHFYLVKGNINRTAI